MKVPAAGEKSSSGAETGSPVRHFTVSCVNDGNPFVSTGTIEADGGMVIHVRIFASGDCDRGLFLRAFRSITIYFGVSHTAVRITFSSDQLLVV